MAFTANSKDDLIVKTVADSSFFLKLLENEKKLQQEVIELKRQLEKKASTQQIGHGTSAASEENGEADEDVAEVDDQEQEVDQEQVGEGKKKHRKKQQQHHPPPQAGPSKTHHKESDNVQAIRKIIREENKILMDEIRALYKKPPPGLQELLDSISVKDLKKVASAAADYIPYVRDVKKLVGLGNNDGQQVGAGDVDPDLAVAPVEEVDDLNAHNDQTLALKNLGQNLPIQKDRFLKSIPKRMHKKASKLLEWFMENPMKVNWNAQGVVSLDNAEISNSNIYSVFKELFSPNPDLSMNGYLQLASFLLNSGMGHLINKKKFWFTARKTKTKLFKKAQQCGGGDMSSDWYFID